MLLSDRLKYLSSRKSRIELIKRRVDGKLDNKSRVIGQKALWHLKFVITRFLRFFSAVRYSSEGDFGHLRTMAIKCCATGEVMLSTS